MCNNDQVAVAIKISLTLLIAQMSVKCLANLCVMLGS